MRDGGEVMRDEQIGQPQFGLQIAQQVQDLRADRNVQRRDRLVQHHQPRRQRQRAGDGDALALPAGKLVRKQIRRVRRQADQIEQLADPLAHLGGRYAFRW